MKSGRWSIAKNAASNVLRGGTTAAVNLALPHFLVRSLDTNRFAAWSLLLQIAAYASFLDFGLQTAVGKFVAELTELGLRDARKRLIETSVCVLLVAAFFAMVVIGGIIFSARQLFSGLPLSLIGEFRIAGLILGCGVALQLVLAPFSGALVGLHRNELPAFATVLSRLSGAFIAILLASHSHSLILLAAVMASANVAAGFIQAVVVLRLLPELRKFKLRIDRQEAKRLFHFSVALGALTVGMFLIQGLDVTIVGTRQFSGVGYYTIATSVVAMLVGLDNAVMSAFLAPLAVFNARQQYSQIARTTLDATWATSFVNFAFLGIFALTGSALLTLWVGPTYAKLAAPILLVLLLAQALRLMTGPLTTALMACNLHKSAIVSAVSEGMVNISASVYLLRLLGPIGVAYGTLIGATVSLIVHTLYTLPRVRQLAIGPRALLTSGIGLPIVGLFPLLSLVLVKETTSANVSIAVISLCIFMSVVCSFFSWRLQRRLPAAIVI